MKNQCTSFVNDWVYSGKLQDRIDRTNTSMVSCRCRIRNQNLNIGWLSCSELCPSLPDSWVRCWARLISHVLGVPLPMLCARHNGNLVGSSCSGNVCCFQKRVCFPRCGNTCLQSSAPVQPLLSSRFPAVFMAANSMCSPPNMMTNFDSP